MKPGKASKETQNPPQYQWPWFVLAAAILAILLAVVWMAGEVQRAKRIRDANLPASPASNNVPAAP